MSYYRAKRTVSNRDISKSKSRTNKFKVRHEYYNAQANQKFKIAKKFYFDIDWVYKVKYTDGDEVIFTEHEFQDLVDRGVFQRVTTKTVEKVAETGHFGDNELFQLT